MPYEKTYKPVLVNFDIRVLAKIDQYKGPNSSRTKLIHDAIELYVEHLEKKGERKSSWVSQIFRKPLI